MSNNEVDVYLKTKQFNIELNKDPLNENKWIQFVQF